MSTAISRIGSREKYAKFVHQGTKPHIIKPTNKKALKFNYRGQTTFAKRVKHPGSKAQPYLKDAVSSVLPADRLRKKRN